ncbi:MAG: Gfo/Idh/MocA family oxidoreductase [Defluviitaleaceae bacterium]|nr:Gfo/Idh/MocA family oxidoreductase [Defluviitaleaceae bacterium]
MHKIIIAGCGGISNAWINVLLKRGDAKIAGLADILPQRAVSQNEKYGLGCNTYASLTEALAGEPDADIVIDNTPPDRHRQIVTEALRAGRHVFGEKPMSDNLEDAEAMVACAAKTGKKYFVMQNYRYNAQITSLRDFLASGELGRVGHIKADFFTGPRFGGFRDEMGSPLIADMAIHTFDEARYITGADAKSVYCHEYNPMWSWYRGAACASAVFEMTSGIVFGYHGSWCALGLNTSWNAEWHILCEKGSAAWVGPRLEYQTESGEVRPVPFKPYERGEGHESCIDDMFCALQNGTEPPTGCGSNINSVRMVMKAQESAKSKAKICIA